MNDLSDQQLASLAIKGNQPALEELIRRYFKLIYSFVYRQINGAAEADDLAQEAFIKMWRHLKKFDQSRNFKTWLYSIARNTVIDYWRKNKELTFSDLEKEEGENPLADILADPAELPPEIFDRQNLAEELEAAIKKLAPIYQTVLNLHYLDGFNFREIAEILNEPIDTVKSRYRRALINLRTPLINRH